ELEAVLARPTHERLAAVAELLRRGTSVERIAEVSTIDRFWLWEIEELVKLEEELRSNFSADAVARARTAGYSTRGIRQLAGADATLPRDGNAFRMVDTAAAEFPARSPYYYLSLDERDEMRKPPREAVVVVGSGPIRIGQGIEFDYSSVHAAWALRAAGCSPVVVNNNPETVSTDFDISDVLVFEPPGADEVEAAYRSTNARGVMLAFGGQTAINLADKLAERGVR